MAEKTARRSPIALIAIGTLNSAEWAIQIIREEIQPVRRVERPYGEHPICVCFRPIADVPLNDQIAAVKQLLGIAALALLGTGCSWRHEQTCSGPSQRVLSRPAPPVVALRGPVTDAANLLSAEQRVTLSRELEQFERRTRHQMVVVTVTSLGGRDVTDFARDLSNSWGIGRKCYDDGIMLLVAPSERKVRIAVGYGLEKTLTHEVSRRILDRKVVPAFRRGDFASGIEAGTRALIAAAS